MILLSTFQLEFHWELPFLFFSLRAKLLIKLERRRRTSSQKWINKQWNETLTYVCTHLLHVMRFDSDAVATLVEGLRRVLRRRRSLAYNVRMYAALFDFFDELNWNLKVIKKITYGKKIWQPKMIPFSLL